MKKLLCMILALTTALSLCACGPKADAPEQGEADDNTVEPKTLVLTCTALDPAQVTEFNSWGPAVAAFKEYVEENSNGRYKVDIVTPLTSSKWEKRAFGRIIANGRKKRDMAPHRFNTASGMVRGDRDVC